MKNIWFTLVLFCIDLDAVTFHLIRECDGTPTSIISVNVEDKEKENLDNFASRLFRQSVEVIGTDIKAGRLISVDVKLKYSNL